ncbi:MAG: hypothetical protein R6W76_17945, partial [Caldilinea sp.]
TVVAAPNASPSKIAPSSRTSIAFTDLHLFDLDGYALIELQMLSYRKQPVHQKERSGSQAQDHSQSLFDLFQRGRRSTAIRFYAVDLIRSPAAAGVQR